MESKVREILTDLERTRENLLALSDDIWLSIEHNDTAALDEGVAFKRAYNEKLSEFDRLATELSELVQRFTEVRLDEAEEPDAEESDEAARQRVVAELDKKTPHYLGESFTYKRPYGFTLRGHAHDSLTVWKYFYLRLLQTLLKMDSAPLTRLAEERSMKDRRKRPYFSTDPTEHRTAMRVTEGLYAESNLSANSIAGAIRRVFAEYGIPEDELKIYLREDRDAG